MDFFMKKVSKCGRPCGKIKTDKIEVCLKPSIKNQFMELLRKEGKQASPEICNMIINYIHSKGGDIDV